MADEEATLMESAVVDHTNGPCVSNTVNVDDKRIESDNEVTNFIVDSIDCIDKIASTLDDKGENKETTAGTVSDSTEMSKSSKGVTSGSDTESDNNLVIDLPQNRCTTAESSENESGTLTRNADESRNVGTGSSECDHVEIKVEPPDSGVYGGVEVGDYRQVTVVDSDTSTDSDSDSSSSDSESESPKQVEIKVEVPDPEEEKQPSRCSTDL